MPRHARRQKPPRTGKSSRCRGASSSSSVRKYTDIVSRQLTLTASSLYRYLGQRVGHGYETVKSRHLCRDSIDAMAHIEIGAKAFSVHFQKRAHSPLLAAAGFDKIDIRVPSLGGLLWALRSS